MQLSLAVSFIPIVYVSFICLFVSLILHSFLSVFRPFILSLHQSAIQDEDCVENAVRADNEDVCVLPSCQSKGMELLRRRELRGEEGREVDDKGK
jgi:hypothetical protein